MRRHAGEFAHVGTPPVHRSIGLDLRVDMGYVTRQRVTLGEDTGGDWENEEVGAEFSLSQP